MTSKRISLRNSLLYSTGIISHALKEAALGVFILFYYKQVLDLSGTLTGLAIAISIIWDGISDPLVGAWSDRLRSPRRCRVVRTQGQGAHQGCQSE